MDENLELFWQQPAFENKQFCFPPKNRIKYKGPNFFNIPYWRVFISNADDVFKKLQINWREVKESPKIFKRFRRYFST